MSFERLAFFYFSITIVYGIADRFTAEMLPRQSISQALETTKMLSRLLIVSDLEGQIYAFDKYTGSFLWENSGLHGRMFTGKYEKPNVPSPLYVFEPFQDGAIYVYFPKAGLQKLPMSIKELVNQSPLRWPDGTVFLGHKRSSTFALDLVTGQEILRLEHGDSIILENQFIESMAERIVSPLLIAVNEYQLTSFSPLAENIAGAINWNVSYTEFSGFLDIFGSPTAPPAETAETKQELEIFTSFNGLFFARDSATRQILWIRQIPSIALSFFSVEYVTGKNNFHLPTLRPIPIMSSLMDEQLENDELLDTEIEVLVNIGRLGDLIYALPSRYFPQLREIFPTHDGTATSQSPNSTETNKALLTAYDLLDKAIEIDESLPIIKTFRDPDCTPSSPNFPACLEGMRIARLLRPVPLLPSAPSPVKGWNWKSPMSYAAIPTFAVILISSLYFLVTKRRRTRPQITRTDQTLTSHPPGFEEIPLHTADIFYAAQSEFDHRSLPKSFLVSDEVIGYGSHGTVVLKGVFDDRPVAVKRMLIDFYDVAGHEVRLLQQSDYHPNVIRYFCRDVTDKFVYIVLELCVCSLADVVENNTGKDLQKASELLTNPKSLFHQLTEGLGHLHKMKLIHRDIKPHNILITPQSRPVLSDFGVSKKLAEDQTSFNPTVQSGTIGWRAPECIVAESVVRFAEETAYSLPQKTARLDEMIDVFALGCIFYYVLTKGEHPFGARLTREINIVKNKYDLRKIAHLPEAMDLIERMIKKNPSERPSCVQILLHPYFWSTQMKISFFLDVSDRLEFEDKLPNSSILEKLEQRRYFIFDGAPVWHKKIDQMVWEDLKSFRRYEIHSVRDLIRAIRNKRNHFHELSPPLRKILGDTPEDLIKYFLDRFPHLLIEIYRVAEETMKSDSPFAGIYFSKTPLKPHDPHLKPPPPH